MMKLGWITVLIAVIWLATSWANMLFIGIAHRDWWPLMPPVSYHVSLALTGILTLTGVVSGIIRSLVKES